MSLTAQHNSVDASVAHPGTIAPRADFGDVRAEFQALVSSSGVYELSLRAKITAYRQRPGALAERHGHEQYPRSRRGSGVYAFLLNPQGHILGDLRLQSGRVVAGRHRSAQVEKILARLRQVHHHGRRRGSEHQRPVDAPSESRDRSREKRCRRPDLTCRNSSHCNLSKSTWQQSPVTLVRGDNPSVESFELWLAPGETERVYEALTKAGAKPVGTTALELLRIAAGHSALRGGHPRTRLAAGDRAGTRFEFFQGLLRRPGDRGAHSIARPGSPQIHRL